MKENGKPIDYFFHKGGRCMSQDGRFINVQTYAAMKEEGLSHDDIMLQFGTSYKQLIDDGNEWLNRERAKIQVKTLRDLMVYIFKNLLTIEEKKSVKVHIDKEMSDEKKIAIFPEKYQFGLRLFLAQRDGRMKDVKREFRTLTKEIK